MTGIPRSRAAATTGSVDWIRSWAVITQSGFSDSIRVRARARQYRHSLVMRTANRNCRAADMPPVRIVRRTTERRRLTNVPTGSCAAPGRPCALPLVWVDGKRGQRQTICSASSVSLAPTSGMNQHSQPASCKARAIGCCCSNDGHASSRNRAHLREGHDATTETSLSIVMALIRTLREHDRAELVHSPQAAQHRANIHEVEMKLPAHLR